ncbi:hypothetical protein ACWGOQ_0016410 [Aquimarina sp. M1]
MNKIIIIVLSIGITLVAYATYYEVICLDLDADFNREISTKKHKTGQEQGLKNQITSIKNYIEILEEEEHYSYQNSSHYNELDLNQPDFIRVNKCVKQYLDKNKFQDNCEDYIIDAIISDFGESNFIEAVIATAIDYRFLGTDYAFPKYLFSNNASLRSKLVLSFLNRYRDPEKLQQTFNEYKTYFYERISKNVYQQIFNNTVSDFISAYEDINQQPDADTYFKDIYFKAETQNAHGKYWNVTFWKRRMLEKNDKTIYAILKEVKNHYDSL